MTHNSLRLAERIFCNFVLGTKFALTFFFASARLCSILNIVSFLLLQFLIDVTVATQNIEQPNLSQPNFLSFGILGQYRVDLFPQGWLIESKIEFVCLRFFQKSCSEVELEP